MKVAREGQVRRRPRVLQLVSLAIGKGQSRGAGGPEVRAAESLPYWDDHYLEVFVAYSSKGQLVREFSSHPRWIDFVVTSSKRLRTILALISIARSREIELIHTQGPVYTDFVATIAAAYLGIPNVVTRAVQISDFSVGALRKYLFLAMDRFTKAKSAAMVGIEQRGMSILVEEGCPQVRIDLIYNGVDTRKFSPDVAPTLTRDDSDAFTIGMVAQMASHKRHDVILKALALSRRDGRNWRVLFVGDGPTLEGLRVESAALGVDDAVTFLGFRRDLPGLYVAMDVVALASDREGLPVTLLEGMATGRPCVASDVGGVSELLARGAGVVVPENTAAAFYGSIATLADDRDRSVRLGNAARQRAVAKFSLDSMVRGYADLYRRVIRTHIGD